MDGGTSVVPPFGFHGRGEARSGSLKTLQLCWSICHRSISRRLTRLLASESAAPY